MKMNGAEIEQSLLTCLYTRKMFNGVYSADTFILPKVVTSYIVVNTDNATSEGKHWIVLFFQTKTCVEIFDSLAQNLTDVLVNKLGEIGVRQYKYNCQKRP